MNSNLLALGTYVQNMLTGLPDLDPA
jgi:C1A family cysteine protease